MPIRPGIPAPSLAPRLGVEVTREHAGVRYLDLQARSLVGRCSTPGMPFEWTSNPFRGCAMGCRYCYAAYTHGYLGRDGGSEFHRTIYVKRGGEDEAVRRLAAAARRGERVALGTATDPYQPAEAHARVTRRLLELAAGVRGLRLSITTKGPLVLRDLDLLSRIRDHGTLSVAVSLISPDAALLRRIEPWAPAPAVRIEVLRQLVAAGVDAGVAVAPVLPALTDGADDLDALLGQAAAAGVRRASLRLLFLRSPTREKYLGWLEREFPEKRNLYRRAYHGRSHLEDGEYPRRIRALFETLRARHRLDEDAFERRAAQTTPLQLALWGEPVQSTATGPRRRRRGRGPGEGRGR